MRITFPPFLRSRLLTAGFALLGALSTGRAAPSTELPEEFYAALEFSVGRFVLVDKGTGQVRIGSVSGTNQVAFATPFRTYMPEVSGITTGLQGPGSEQVAISSTTKNRVVFAPLGGGASINYFPQHPGPSGLALVRETNFSPDRLLLDSRWGPGGAPTLEMTEDANLGTPNFIDDASNLASMESLQPLYEAPNLRREAVIVWDTEGATPRLLTLFDTAGFVGGTFAQDLPPGTRLASNVRDVANRLMVVGYVPGSPSLTLVTIDTVPTPWDADNSGNPYPVDAAPFPVREVSAVSGLGGGAPQGILITSEDGSQTALARIINGGTQLDIVQIFESNLAEGITGAVMIPGRGIMIFEGPAGRSTDYYFHSWTGAAFELQDKGTLPSLLPPQVEFATILWYDAEPLVDPDANLLRLDVEPDWSNGTGPLPAALTRETFAGTMEGLDNPVPIGLAPPSGATHVITNQLLPECSLSVLQPNSTILDPPLSVLPVSGNYDDPVLIEADTADTIYDIFYRENRAGVPWRQFDFSFGVGYPSTWLFYAKHKVTGVTGPILIRTYTFDPAAYPFFDSDNDGVPDFVEQWALLDPNGGADSDNDLQSDMEELLDGNDPNDVNDFEPDATRSPPFIGQGFLLIAAATDTTTGRASPGEQIEVRNMSSAVLDYAPVEPLTSPVALAGELGAPLTVNTPVSFRHLAILNSPKYFDLGDTPTPPRDGREVYRALEIPVIPLPVINPVLSGTDLDADAADWIAAAQAAYAAYEPVDTITEITPLDTAVAVVVEAALYDALLALDPALQTSLGVPQDIPADPGPPVVPFKPGFELFTLFGDRDGDAERTDLSEAMLAALEADGLSFVNLLTQVESSIASAVNLQALVTALYDWHVVHSDPDDELNYMPALPLPLDVLRGLVRGEDLPFEENPDPPGPPNWDYRPAALQPLVDSAKIELATALAELANAYRPVETWTIEVGPPTIPGQTYGFTNTGTLNPVALLDEFGEFVLLEQGLGLSFGAQYSVIGYTDVTGPAGHDAIEAIAVTVLSIPLASDNDLNGNLLDDKWEEFFFGAVGVVDAFDTHPTSGLTYLAYHLSGADPRDDSTDEPSFDAPLPSIEIVILPNTNYGIQFAFPEEYFDAVDWGAEESADLITFNPIPGASVQALGGGLYVIDVGALLSGNMTQFFRLTMTLK